MRGCPYCAPMDKAVRDIVDQGDESLIFLSCHVSYFDVPDAYIDADNPGTYNDPFAQEFCDERHGRYSVAFRDGQIYTPQTIINGWLETPEDDTAALMPSITQARAQDQLASIALGLVNDALVIDLPALTLEEPAELWLFGYSKRRSVEGAAGLERGETITYANVVTYLRALEDWDGAAKSMSVDLVDMIAEGYAVSVQNPQSMKVIAVGRVERD